MTETVYIETSIIGYLTARPSRNLILVANAEITREWWETRRSDFELYTSQAVVREVAQGDAEIAARRLEIIRDLPLLDLNQLVLDLAEQFLARSNLPPKADVDALPIAAATIHEMDYLHGVANILQTPKFSENYQRLVLILGTSYQFFAHLTNYLEADNVSG